MKLQTCAIILFIIITILPKNSGAQVYIGLDGLTCSMCSNSIYNLLRKVNGVKEVKMDLNENIAEVTFEENIRPNYSKLSQGVYDAGFSVRFMKENISLENGVAKFGRHYLMNGIDFIYIGREDKAIEGRTTISLIGKGFMSKKELKKFESALKNLRNTSTDHTYYFVF